MSVTFAAETTSAADARQFELTCSTGAVLGTWTGYANAYAEAQAHGLLCTDDLCQGYGADVDEVHADGEPVPVNVNNRNAITILTALGYPVELEDPELLGEADAADFLARVDLADALAPVSPAIEEVAYQDGNTGRPGAQVVECGRREGYLQDVLPALRALAVACQAAGLRVTWG